MKSEFSLKQLLVIFLISIGFIFGFIKLETGGVKIYPNSYSVSLNEDIVLTLENDTIWPIRIPKCDGQNISTQVSVPNGWRELGTGNPCANITSSNSYSFSFEIVWPFQKKQFVFSPKGHNFLPGVYIFGLWADTSPIHNKGSIFAASPTTFVQTKPVEIR